MFNKRFLNTLPGEYVTFNIASSLNPIAGGLAALTAVLKHEVDMTISYTGWNNSAYSFFRSDDLKTTAYHELTHAAHNARMKGNWYDQFVNAELAEIITNTGKSSSPYGNGTNNNSAIIFRPFWCSSPTKAENNNKIYQIINAFTSPLLKNPTVKTHFI